MPFRSEKGIDFAHIGLESGVVFEETTKAGVKVFIVSILNGSERKSNMGIRNREPGVTP